MGKLRPEPDSRQEFDPSTDCFPTVSIRTVKHERPLKARSLKAFGVTGLDLTDMVQVVTFAAWQAIRAAKFAGTTMERIIGAPMAADRCPHCGRGAP